MGSDVCVCARSKCILFHFFMVREGRRQNVITSDYRAIRICIARHICPTISFVIQMQIHVHRKAISIVNWHRAVGGISIPAGIINIV